MPRKHKLNGCNLTFSRSGQRQPRTPHAPKSQDADNFEQGQGRKEQAASRRTAMALQMELGHFCFFTKVASCVSTGIPGHIEPILSRQCPGDQNWIENKKQQLSCESEALHLESVWRCRVFVVGPWFVCLVVRVRCFFSFVGGWLLVVGGCWLV